MGKQDLDWFHDRLSTGNVLPHFLLPGDLMGNIAEGTGFASDQVII